MGPEFYLSIQADGNKDGLGVWAISEGDTGVYGIAVLRFFHAVFR